MASHERLMMSDEGWLWCHNKGLQWCHKGLQWCHKGWHWCRDKDDASFHSKKSDYVFFLMMHTVKGERAT